MRVADSVAREPWSNDELATAVRLMGYLHTRWARDGLSTEDGCRVVLSAGQLMDLTGSGSLVRARRTLRALAAHVTLTVDEDGAYTRVEWRKFADFQGWAPECREEAGQATGREMPPPHPASRIPQPATEEELPKEHPAPIDSSASSHRARPMPTAVDGGRRPVGEGGEEEETKVLDILARLRADDQPPTRALRRIVREVPWDVIEATLHDAWARHVDGLVSNPVAYFQASVREKAEALGISLGSRDTPKFRSTENTREAFV